MNLSKAQYGSGKKLLLIQYKELTKMKSQGTNIDINELRHLMLTKKDGQNIVSLIDKDGYQILRGYGPSIVEAINDLHAGLL